MAETSSTLFVGDLPPEIHESDFMAAFKQFRGFTTARLRQDKNDRYFGFVEFEDHDSAARARDAMVDYRFSRNDRNIIIQFSNPSRSSSKRGRSDDHYTPSSHASSSSSSNSSYGQPPYGYYGGYGPYGAPTSHMYNSLPSDASSTLFVEGLPSDITVREVSHIFRPFPGYQSLRIVPKESKSDPAKVFTLCFVEYDTKVQSTCAMHQLQGYRIDEKDLHGLRISYARSNLARRGGGGAGGAGGGGDRDREDRGDRRREGRDGREGREGREGRDGRDNRENRDTRETRDNRDRDRDRDRDGRDDRDKMDTMPTQ